MATLPGEAALTPSDLSDPNAVPANTDENIVDVDAPIDDPAAYDYNYSDPAAEGNAVSASANILKNSHLEPKVIAVIAAVAAVVIDGAVVAVILIRKKNQAA